MRISKSKVMLLMAEREMFQKDLADKVGMSRGNLSVILNGKQCHPRTVLKIASALGVEAKEVLDGDVM